MKRCVALILILALVIGSCGGGSPAARVAPPSNGPEDSTATAGTIAMLPPEAGGAIPVASTQSPTVEASSAVPSQASLPTRTTVPVATDTPVPLLATLYVQTPEFKGANLRSRPTTSSSVILTMPYGARVRALARRVRGTDGDAWYKVVYRSRTGYVFASLLGSRKLAPTAVPTVPPAARRGRTWTLTAVGDIMLSRTVLRRIQAYGDYRHPYRQTADILRSADLTVANLECPLSDNVVPSSDPHTFTFVAPTMAATGLKWAGIDGVSLANNHTMNFGQRPLVDTIDALDRYGIGHFGAGVNRKSAYSSTIFRVNGLRVAMLGFEAVNFWQWSDPSAPGTATAWEGSVRDAIRAARPRADVVIPFFHWGVEYTSVPSEFQRRMARVAVNAGADLVLGAHPHWVQQVERYRGKLIVYSMGNFVFDQMWSRETRQGVIATFEFKGSSVVGVKYTPVLMQDYHQPQVATGADYYAVLKRMKVSR